MARVKQFGSKTELLTRFNPQAQVKAIRNELLMFKAERFPRLSEVEAVHGTETIIDWLIIQIDDALNSSGVTIMKSRIGQITELAHVIYTRYHYLTLPELLLFFFKFKNGDFGDFNGVFNQQRFMKTFTDFKKYRTGMQQKLQQAELDKQAYEWRYKAISWDEYLALKNEK